MKTTIPPFSRTAALLCGGTAAIGRHRYRQVSNGPRTERLSRSITGLLRHRNPTLKPLLARLQAAHVDDPSLSVATGLDQPALSPLARGFIFDASIMTRAASSVNVHSRATNAWDRQWSLLFSDDSSGLSEPTCASGIRPRAACGETNSRTHASQQKVFYSITSSAVASNIAGTSRPSVLAVFRLMTNSNLVGRTTGKSLGFSPLRIRPA